jgi:hypothetical protein
VQHQALRRSAKEGYQRNENLARENGTRDYIFINSSLVAGPFARRKIGIYRKGSGTTLSGTSPARASRFRHQIR